MCVYECLSSLLKVFVMKKHVLSVEFAVFKVELLCVKGIKEYSLTISHCLGAEWVIIQYNAGISPLLPRSCLFALN